MLQRRPPLRSDLPAAWAAATIDAPPAWIRYWRDHPINAWIGGNRPGAPAWFQLEADRFVPRILIEQNHVAMFGALVQEVLDFRLATYTQRRAPAPVIPISTTRTTQGTELPYFPNLRIACGHFKSGDTAVAEHRTVPGGFGRLQPERHFVARASGNSMDGGRHPICDGDYLLLELITPVSAGSLAGSVVVIERAGAAGDFEYLLRNVINGEDGRYVLRANNPAYADLEASEDFRTLARLRAVLGAAMPGDDGPPS